MIDSVKIKYIILYYAKLISVLNYIILGPYKNFKNFKKVLRNIVDTKKKNNTNLTKYTLKIRKIC